MIPGGWHGGWAFDPIMEKMQKLGHQLLPLTLPGLETSGSNADQIINLDAHIDHVVDYILSKNLKDIILAGHSYGGLVITGVADRIPEKIKTLVYIDAYIPENGDSCWSLTSDIYRELFITGVQKDGIWVGVPPGTESRRVPHPMASYLQSIHLKGAYKRVLNRVLIYAGGWAATPFKNQFERLKSNADWHVETLMCGHNIMREQPDELVAILNKIAAY